jgi:hypothetical protein
MVTGEHNMSNQDTEPRIADDLMRGAKAISEGTGLTEHQVYHAARTKTLPIFCVGGTLHARRSALREHYAKLEAQQGQVG